MKKSFFCLLFAFILIFAVGCASESTTTAPPNTYTVTFKQDGCADIVVTVEKGQDLNEIDFPLITVKEGYAVEWDSDDIKNIQDNVVINALITPNVYKAELNADGGYVSETVVYANYNEKITLPIPKKDDCEFLGWFYADDTTAKFDAENTVMTEHLILIAKWEVVQNWSNLY